MAVGRIDRASGEHVGAADEVRVQVAPDHEHLEPVGAVAQDQDRGRVPQDDVGHPRSSGGSGPSGLWPASSAVRHRTRLDILHVARAERTDEAGRTGPADHGEARGRSGPALNRLISSRRTSALVGGMSSRKPKMSVTKPGVTMSTPAVRMRNPSTSSLLGHPALLERSGDPVEHADALPLHRAMRRAGSRRSAGRASPSPPMTWAT